MIGKKYGKWTVLELREHRNCLVRCNCGAEKIRRQRDLVTGRTTKCKRCHSCAQTLHGLSKTPEYNSVSKHYQHIFTSDEIKFHTYKGMPFEDEWNPQKGGSYAAGARWILDNLGPRPNKRRSIDIINHERGFVKGNLRWATRKQQARNRRDKSGFPPLAVVQALAAKMGYKLVPISN